MVRKSTGIIYAVLNIERISCGCWIVDIGLKRNYGNPYCTEHDAFLNMSGNIDWVKSYAFRPVQEAKMIKVSFEKILEEVPVGAN